ncbi:type II toxin-antitoxin system RelE/ParE family toxin [Brotonthovivens ammoniilytica]|uniref:Type II toxin-antitoxin system RelE/ParE family toxin n=1 Tax=Brotonthovivens ammoniilytica TaxID=2981725 RepID=A0ABT2TG13_9FIRM|nr:type II toxin-antitoxin system RelE/ParE family toxin [Brotonthovivens ammoniilytica]MCU6761082.1 type II toxin-antitoxin system RelE/ParE family toxin [Brotonthovivens ammoniilytica]
MFYVWPENDRIYLLHACRKQKNKTEIKDKKIIEARAKELGKTMGRSLI